METAVVLTSMPGGVGGQRRKPLPTRLGYAFSGTRELHRSDIFGVESSKKKIIVNGDFIYRSSGAL